MKRSFIKLLVFLLITIAAFQSSAQFKIGDQPTLLRKAVALDAQGSNGLQGLWLPRVTDTSITGIRALNPPDGLIIYHPPSGKLFIRSNNVWVSYLSQAITTISSAGQSVAGPNVSFQTGTAAGTGNDFNITANSAANTVTLNMPDASPVVRGAVTSLPQSFGGYKTFDSGVTVNKGASITGATNYISNLKLGITSNTAAGPPVEQFLSVNSSGNVTLHSSNVTANTTTRIKSFAVGFANNEQLRPGEYAIYSFAPPAGITLSINSTVTVSPVAAMDKNFKINWARVNESLMVEISVAAGNVPNNFNPGQGMAFRVSVFEY